jgi:transcriptional regulator with XRE-family HTH domain
MDSEAVVDIAFKGNRLRALRHERELSADKLARRTGLTTHHIYRLERGERPNVWGTTVAKLAVALNTSTDYLLNLTDDSKPPRPREPYRVR